MVTEESLIFLNFLAGSVFIFGFKLPMGKYFSIFLFYFQVGNTVGYQVRLESKVNPAVGRILYCTTGILLRRLQSDPAISDYTHILLDEAHERDVNTDLLMNLLRRAVDLNPNLKLVIMSATIDAEMFQK